MLSAWFSSGRQRLGLSIVVNIVHAGSESNAFLEVEDKAKCCISVEIVAMKSFAP
jgi:hypothetical protein